MSKRKADIVLELHKPARKNFRRRSVIIRGLDDLWQADLADFQLYARENRRYKYILVVIDCFSKYVWTFKLKTKNASEVTNAMATLLKQGRVLKNLQTDSGTEFFNKHFKVLMEKYKINHYTTYSTKKASIVERVIRTLKEKLYKQFSLHGSYNWIKLLNEITEQYNDTVHSTIRMKPKDVTLKRKIFY